MVILNDFNTTVHRALSEINKNYLNLPGLVICGTHSPHDTEYLIDEITKARESGLPTLLICFGHQLGAIEYARNILGIKNATSEEFGEGEFVVKKRPELKVGLHEGASWWSNYEVVIDYEYPDNFISVPFHPEYQSSKDNPHPLLVKFLDKCNMYGRQH
jgi:CTP synthase (UTP-ammonia lyase)